MATTITTTTTTTTTSTTTIFSLQSWFVSCRKKYVMSLLGLYNLEVSQRRHVRQCNQSFSHSVTLRLTLYQTSRLDFEPLIGHTANEHWVTLPPRHTSHRFSPQYRGAERLWSQNTSTARAQSAVLGSQYVNSVKLIVILRFVFFAPTISVQRPGVVLKNTDNM